MNTSHDITNDADPKCPDSCKGCENLPYGESVRKEQRAMMAAAIKGQAIFENIMTETEKTPRELWDQRDMAMAAMLYGSTLAAVIGMLIDKGHADLAHRAVAIYQDIYSNGDTWYTGELYEEILAEIEAKRYAPPAALAAQVGLEATSAVSS